MRKYWAMKTFVEWWNTFNQNNVIGIDQEGVDRDYMTYTDTDINGLITSNIGVTEYIDRVFREFCKWMQVGDLVIIGTGHMTQFNVSGIVRIADQYRFDSTAEPRHLRNVKILRSLNPSRPMQRFSRTSRLELIDESDFYEAIIMMI